MTLLRHLDVAGDSLLALVYPQACEVCGGSVEARKLGFACADCWRQTKILSGSETCCWKCGLLSVGTIDEQHREEVRCRRCDDDSFTAARACGVYEKALRVSIFALKRKPHVPPAIVEIMANAQRRSPLNRATRILPVPLHPEREKARGHNQAALIAHELSKAVSLPVDCASLVRTKHTERHRAGMDARERRETVDDSFHVMYPALVAGEKVLLVDDVFTTGATVSSCASALLSAGAAEVLVLTIARPSRY